MIKTHRQGRLQHIPVDAIEVMNPRDRNAKVFSSIVENIQTIGLKKPITVTPRQTNDGSARYLLICGEGRLKAFQSLGHAEIPAIVLDVGDEDAYIMSLAENIARRKFSPLELLAGIEQLVEQGYDKKAIADKTGLSLEYVHGITNLLEQGEERLLAAVEAGNIALNAALEIARGGNDDKAIQAALQEAYESGQLRGKQLIRAKKLVQQRRTLGRSIARSGSCKTSDVSSISLVRSYQKEVERQKLFIKKAEFTQRRLLFIVGALRQLFADEHFATLLRAEGLVDLPSYLADRLWPEGQST